MRRSRRLAAWLTKLKSRRQLLKSRNKISVHLVQRLSRLPMFPLNLPIPMGTHRQSTICSWEHQNSVIDPNMQGVSQALMTILQWPFSIIWRAREVTMRLKKKKTRPDETPQDTASGYENKQNISRQDLESNDPF